MAEILYLKRRERPSKRKPFVFIVCRSTGGEEYEPGPNGIVIRTTPEYVAKYISDFYDSDATIYVQGVPSRADLEANGKQQCTRLTIEDLKREGEISAAVDEKIHHTAQSLMQLDAAQRTDVDIVTRHLIKDCLRAAPKDDYGQRRTMEKLLQAVSNCKLASMDLYRAAQAEILPDLLDAWKRARSQSAS